jgi:hypothetical protein
VAGCGGVEIGLRSVEDNQVSRNWFYASGGEIRVNRFTENDRVMRSEGEEPERVRLNLSCNE